MKDNLFSYRKDPRWLTFFMKQILNFDLVKFVMCTPVFRNCVPFSKYIKRHVYPWNQGTHNKLNQIRLGTNSLGSKFYICSSNCLLPRIYTAMSHFHFLLGIMIINTSSFMEKSKKNFDIYTSFKSTIFQLESCIHLI